MASLFSLRRAPPGTACSVLGAVFGGDEEGFEELRQRVRHLLWFTYRKNIPGAFSTDRGWGCTIRSTQMLFANVLLRVAQHALAARSPSSSADSGGDARRLASPEDSSRGDDAARAGARTAASDSLSGSRAVEGSDGSDGTDSPTSRSATELVALRRAIAHMFLDWPVPSAPFSIQRFVEASGFDAGRWYAPHESSHIIAKLARCTAARHETLEGSPDGSETDGASVALRLPGVHVVICPDSCIATDEICAVATSQPLDACGSDGMDAASMGSWQPTLVIIPLRLGLDAISAEAGASLVQLLKLPAFAGAVGGSPRHSVYFIGVAGQHLLCLDPHTTQRCPEWSSPPVSPQGGSATDSPPPIAAPCTCDAWSSEVPSEVGGSRVVRIPMCSTARTPPAEATGFLQSLVPPPEEAPWMMHVARLDPTITISFLFLSFADLMSWRDQVIAINSAAKTTVTGGGQPVQATRIVEVVTSRPDFTKVRLSEGDDDFLACSDNVGEQGADRPVAQPPAPDLDSNSRSQLPTLVARRMLQHLMKSDFLENIMQIFRLAPESTASCAQGEQSPEGSAVAIAAEMPTQRSRGMSFALVDEYGSCVGTPSVLGGTPVVVPEPGCSANTAAGARNAGHHGVFPMPATPDSTTSTRSSLASLRATTTPPHHPSSPPLRSQGGIALATDKPPPSARSTGSPFLSGAPPPDGGGSLPPRPPHSRVNSFAEVLWNPKQSASPVIKSTQLDAPFPPAFSLDDQPTPPAGKDDAAEVPLAPRLGEHAAGSNPLVASTQRRSFAENRAGTAPNSARGSLSEWHLVNALTASDTC